MTIKLQTLQDFKKESAFIKSSGIIPILSYIKFSPGTITKDNLNQFIDYNCDEVTESFLVEERVFSNFLSVAKSDVAFKVTEKQIIISDGSLTIKTPVESVDNFPKHIEPDDLQSVSDETFQAISCAAQFISEDLMLGVKAFVFSGNNYVAGTDGFIGYLEEVGNCPELILDKGTAVKVGTFNSTHFCDTDKYWVFVNGKATYGFIKHDQAFFDLSPLNKIPSTEPFEINKRSWIDFNNLCISSTITKGINCVLNNGTLSMDDHSVEVSHTIPSGDVSFKYAPILLNRLFNAVPDETLKVYRDKTALKIQGTNFLTLIQEMI